MNELAVPVDVEANFASRVDADFETWHNPLGKRSPQFGI
jgi:hypothetical protein